MKIIRAPLPFTTAKTNPTFTGRAAYMKQRDARLSQRMTEFARVVAERDGRIVGVAAIQSHWGSFHEPHRYWVMLSTHEDHRRQGVDNAMIHGLLDLVAPDQPEQLWTCIRQDFVPMTEFLDAFNFSEEFRSWGSHLDVQAFDYEAFRPLAHKLEANGIRFIPYAALNDPAREEKLLALHRQVEADVPFYEPIIPQAFDDIRQTHIPDESCFVALGGDQIIGMACLNTKAPDHLQNGLTGVHPDYRNRGIATVLKALVADFAKKQGHDDINAAGSGENQAMLQVNRRLGYHIEPWWLTLKALL